MDVLTFDAGLAYKLKKAFAKAGWTETDINAFAESDKLGEHRKILLGHAVITVPEHLIDLDADPFVPNGWKVEEHQKGGQFKWDASKVKLHLSKKQQGGKVLEGNRLREELKGNIVYNANLLDYLLKNPHLIPGEILRNKDVYFWGTVYGAPDGRYYVRYLEWLRVRWAWGCKWLGNDWGIHEPAAVPAS